jgi:hypothetical protein
MANQWQDEREGVRFPEWMEVLAQLKIGDEAKASVRQGLYAYLRWCKQSRTFACIATAKSYISELEAAGKNPNKPALRWFFKEAKKMAGRQKAEAKGQKDETKFETASAVPLLQKAMVGAGAQVAGSSKEGRSMEPGAGVRSGLDA